MSTPARHIAFVLGLLTLTRGLAGQAPAPGRTADPEWPRLGYWRFNTPGFASESGQTPVIANDLSNEPGFDGGMVLITSTNRRPHLVFPLRDDQGRANFDPQNGAIRFLFQAPWATRVRGPRIHYNWGTGPGHWVRLLEVGPGRGAVGSPWFAVSIDPEGTNLFFHSWDSAGNPRTNLQAELDWTYISPKAVRTKVEPPWREVIVSYTPTNCAAVVDGRLLQDIRTKAWTGYPGVGPVRPGVPGALAIGTALAGGLEAEGWFDELETFGGPVTPLRSYALLESCALTATVSTDPLRVILRWYGRNQNALPVRRRMTTETNWVTLAPAIRALEFTDASPELEVGRTYEYQVGRQSLLVGLDAAPIEDRGRVILLVDQTLAGRLGRALEQFGANLVGDGWTVIRHEVPRQEDEVWSRPGAQPRYIENLERTKSRILAEYAADPGRTRAVILIGHVTVPYSGISFEDGHLDHNGAWPADAYYGDMDGVWSDHVMNSGTNIAHPVLRNLPGDGKLDPYEFGLYISGPGSAGSNGVELAVGRIDFANLPAFAPKTELDLLRQYFEKNHRYRHGGMRFARLAAVGAYFWSTYHEQSAVLYQNAAWLGSRLTGLRGDSVTDANVFGVGEPCQWAFQGGYGAPSTLHNSPDANRAQGIRSVTSADLARPGSEPRAAFLVMKGSYFGDWNFLPNAFMRALLATPDHGLMACWTRDLVWRFEATAVGDTIGSALPLSTRNRPSTRTTYLLGDPTLRLDVLPPPTALEARRRGGTVTLDWSSPGPAETRHYVYRSDQGPLGPFRRITSAAVSGRSYRDDAAPAGRPWYQVRALARVVTGSGSYTNLSQAAFARAN